MRVTVEVNGDNYVLELPEETVRALEEIAVRNGLSFEEALKPALQQAIANENFIERAVAGGAKLLIEKDNKVNELEFA
jgi:hypothetical protein